MDDFYAQCAGIVGTSGLDTATDPLRIMPADAEQLAELVKLCRDRRHPLAILGGGTAPVPPIPREAAVVSVSGLNRVHEIAPDDFLMVVQAGVTVDDAMAAAKRAGLSFPLDITSGDRATVGGAFLTGAAGIADATGEGVARAVTGIRAVAPDGSMVTFGGRTVKNVTGYEMVRFLAGSMGAFAAITELTVRLSPRPVAAMVVSGTFPGSSSPEAVIGTLSVLRDDMWQFEVTASDGLGSVWAVHAGFAGLPEQVERHASRAGHLMLAAGAATVGRNTPEMFRGLRRAIARDLAGGDLTTVRLGTAAVGPFLARLRNSAPGDPVLGHLLSGRVHVISRSGRHAAVHDAARALGGSAPLSWARIRTDGYAHTFSASQAALVSALKTQIDPAAILNPHLRFP